MTVPEYVPTFFYHRVGLGKEKVKWELNPRPNLGKVILASTETRPDSWNMSNFDIFTLFTAAFGTRAIFCLFWFRGKAGEFPTSKGEEENRTSKQGKLTRADEKLEKIHHGNKFKISSQGSWTWSHRISIVLLCPSRLFCVMCSELVVLCSYILSWCIVSLFEFVICAFRFQDYSSRRLQISITLLSIYACTESLVRRNKVWSWVSWHYT